MKHSLKFTYFSCSKYFFKMDFRFYFKTTFKSCLRFAIVFFCIFPQIVFSQWKLLSSNLDNSGITAICANENVWLAGEQFKDVLWYSTDKGKSWKTIDKGEKQFTYGYKTIVNNKGRIVTGVLDGDRGYWGTYDKSGQERIAGGFSSQSINVIFYPDNEWLRIEFGIILRSVDGGITWQSEQSNLFFPPNTSIFPYTAIEKNGVLYLGGSPSVVSTDKGKSFQLYDLPAEKAALLNMTICKDKMIAVFSKSTTEKIDLKIYSSPLGVKPNWTLQNDISDKGFGEIWRFEGYQNHLFGIGLSAGPTNLFYSNDSGKTINTISNGLNSSTYPFCVQVLGDTILLGTSKGLYWTKLSEINKVIVLSNKNNAGSRTFIYPNPVLNNFIVETKKTISKIELTDLLGKIYPIDHITLTENKSQFSSQNLPNGLYFVAIYFQDNSKEAIKLIVQH